MPRPLLSVLTTALLCAAPALASAAPAQPRYTASSSVTPSPVARAGRFALEARVSVPGGPIATADKQPDRPPTTAADTPLLTARFTLTAAVRDKSLPTPDGVCAADDLFRNSFE